MRPVQSPQLHAIRLFRWRLISLIHAGPRLQVLLSKCLCGFDNRASVSWDDAIWGGAAANTLSLASLDDACAAVAVERNEVLGTGPVIPAPSLAD